MKTIRLECTDSDNITVSTTVIMDFQNERSVETGLIEIIRYLQRIGLDLPPDMAEILAAHTTPRRQFLRG